MTPDLSDKGKETLIVWGPLLAETVLLSVPVLLLAGFDADRKTIFGGR